MAYQVHLVIGIVIVLAILAGIVVRPRGLSEAWVALGGAAILLVGGYLQIGEVPRVLAAQANVYGFFLGLMTIAALAEQAGVFDLFSTLIARLAGGSGFRLYLGVFALGALTTMFFSNDATALILTPIVYTLVTRLRLPVLPFMFACTFIADTASFLLPVSNPTNILVLDAFGTGLRPFLSYLFVPALVCIGINVMLFLVVFRHPLRTRYSTKELHLHPSSLVTPSAGLLSLGWVLLRQATWLPQRYRCRSHSLLSAVACSYCRDVTSRVGAYRLAAVSRQKTPLVLVRLHHGLVSGRAGGRPLRHTHPAEPNSGERC